MLFMKEKELFYFIFHYNLCHNHFVINLREVLNQELKKNGLLCIVFTH